PTSLLFTKTTPPPLPAPLSLHDALPISRVLDQHDRVWLDHHEGRLDHSLERHLREEPQAVLARRNPHLFLIRAWTDFDLEQVRIDRKSTRLNSSHVSISYAVFCLKKKTQ